MLKLKATTLPETFAPTYKTINEKLNADSLSAYNTCLRLEDEARRTALTEIVEEIHSCRGEKDTLLELGKFYVDYYIQSFKNRRKKTPDSSEYASRSSFDNDEDALLAVLKQAPQDNRMAKKQALIRDSYRCVVTGKYHAEIPASFNIDEENRNRVGSVFTECARIVPEATHFEISDEVSQVNKRDYSASLLAVLHRFGYNVDDLYDSKIHSLYNVMTLEHNVHVAFDRLDLWFEATDIENCYNIMTLFGLKPLPEKITFTRPAILSPGSHTESPFPSPELLNLHASCAKVAHLSGVAEYLDELDDNLDELQVLAADGGSSDVLSHALLRSLSFMPSSRR
ncbi:hypothetical protein E1B28_003269 [Marasmius oreades]|uniref:HNH nuclease domain-containing protein n=1 Tax=Marasmius oreades TaxID=181124 RepID=A0A9P7UM77_9AGAR|nr:uncharacterized protein E1B28_003269 [Marasmius oreades]KAG7085726.1 hypothetical protein E1B28_003269 [Marasmius oreades]